MALITGTPLGSVTSSEDIYLEGAPTLYIQDYNADPLKNPDSDNFYWGLSGTSSYPALEIGCLTDVSLSEDLTMNDVLCDNVGVKDTLMQRNYIDWTFTIQSFFPFATLTEVLKGGAVTENAAEHTQKFGLGKVDNNQFWMVYAPKVYDEDVGDYVAIHMHKAKFVDAWEITMPFGDSWEAGITLRGFADTSKPSAQQFATVIRADTSVI
ncbi:hypothetical protein GF373_17365 [bacterium]|nr:hypothetical protein [bacterium]